MNNKIRMTSFKRIDELDKQHNESIFFLDKDNLWSYLSNIFQEIFDIFPKTINIINNNSKENKLFLELIKKWDKKELKIFSLKNNDAKIEFINYILERE